LFFPGIAPLGRVETVHQPIRKELEKTEKKQENRLISSIGQSINTSASKIVKNGGKTK
jgi:hypothetical protein